MGVAVSVVMVFTMMVVIVARRYQDIELCRAQIGPHHTRHLEFIVLDRQLFELGFQVLEIEPEIKKRTNGHIAADAGKTVEIKGLHTKGMLARANIPFYA